MWKIYETNVAGVLIGGFPGLNDRMGFTESYSRSNSMSPKQSDPPIHPMCYSSRRSGETHSFGAWLAVIFHIIFLPITLTIVAGIKTLFDYFTRKELPDEQLDQLISKVDTLDNDGIEPLIDKIVKYSSDSNASGVLKTHLRSVSHEAYDAVQKAQIEKTSALKLAQLTTIQHPDPRKVYSYDYINKVKLDETHQKELDTFCAQNKTDCHTKKLVQQKTSIKEYLSADYNAGKKMQHIINNHFFPQQAAAQPEVASKDKPIQVLAP